MSESPPEKPESGIEESIEAASFGEKEAIEKFFTSFLNDPLYVPERYQPMRLTHEPRYPNDFVNILGLQDSERVIVPVFSRPEMIEEWCGQKLNYKSHSGAKLLELMPEQWWICVNPGQEVEKEISPWEIDRLRGGRDYISEIISELDEGKINQSIEIAPLEPGEYAALKEKLIEKAGTNEKVLRLFLVKEKSVSTDSEESSVLLLGIEAEASGSGELEEIKDQFRVVTDLAMIGDDRVKIVTGTSGNNITLGIFANYEPVYISSSASPHEPPGILDFLNKK